MPARRDHGFRHGGALATKREVEAKLRELIRRLAAAEEVQGSLADTLPDARIVAIRIPDLDAEYWAQMAGGKMDRLHTGSPARSDIRIRVGSDHLVELVDGKRSMFSSVVAGHVKVEASVADLLRLRRLA